jgi:ubiquinol-cytochrome c reductase cytochrome c1 subunit
MLKRSVLIAMALLSAGSVMAEEGGIALLSAGTDIANTESLQRGARNFMNYCSGCHSLEIFALQPFGGGPKIPESQLGNLMFTTDKAFDTINSAMPKDSEAWFGKQHAGSVVDRAGQGAPITFIHSSTASTPTRPGLGRIICTSAECCNARCAGALHGLQKPVLQERGGREGQCQDGAGGVEAMTPGALKPEEYDQFVRDIVNFLDYAGEPVKDKRQSMGIFVTLFLLVFFVFAYLLKKEYWKDVH